MNGILAQFISIVSNGNNYLQKDKEWKDWDKNTTFQFCNLVDFYDFTNILIANNPNDWFKFLKREGCEKLRLSFQYSPEHPSRPDYKYAGFVGGGGLWLIESVYKKYSQFWSSKWIGRQPDSINNKIWSVTYRRQFKKFDTKNIQYDKLSLKTELYSLLYEVIGFSKKNDLKIWIDCFSKSLLIFESDFPNKKYYHTDLIVNENYNLFDSQLLFTAGSAFVFGGMGSWNDLGFKDKDDELLYEKLSGNLYDLIIKCILAVINK